MTQPQKEDAPGDEERGVEWYREALAKAEAEIQKKDSIVEEIRNSNHRHVARLAALTEENKELQNERDSCCGQLEALQAAMEEMTAAARFADREWREHCDRQEAIIVSLVKEAFEMLPNAEAAARHTLQRSEEEARDSLCGGEETATGLLPPRAAYHAVVANARARQTTAGQEQAEADAELQLQWLSRAVGCTRQGLHDKFLSERTNKESENEEDEDGFSSKEEGLYELYLALCDLGFPTDTALTKLLEKETELFSLRFNAVGHEPDFGNEAYAIPPRVGYDFHVRLLRHLPKLQYPHFSHLPSLSSAGARKALTGATWKASDLRLAHTKFTVADLLRLHKHCPQLKYLHVHASCCTNWGPFAHIEDLNERKAALAEACDTNVWWFD